MVHALSLAPFSPLSPLASLSQSHSQSLSASPSTSDFSHRLCLFCNAVPQSKSQSRNITNNPKPPQSTINFPNYTSAGNILGKTQRKPHQQHYKGKGKLGKDEMERTRHWKEGPISTQEALNHFHSLLALHPTSIHPFNQLLAALVSNKTSSDSYPAIFSLFNLLTQTEGIRPDKYTYVIMVQLCVQTNRLSLAFSFLGQLLK